MVKCICIDDTNRPEEIPESKWVKLGGIYTITFIHYHSLQGVMACDLKEITLTPECYPFETFKLSRFAFTQEALIALSELAQACSELNKSDINKAIKELDLETVDI